MTRFGILLSCAAFVLFVSVPAAGAADAIVCEPGSGAGKCSSPRAVAVDREGGILFVSDRGNNRVDVFKADGTFLRAFGWKVNAATPEEKLQTCTTASGCLKGSSGSGAGQFKGLGGIAVDNDPASPAFHDVYAFDGENNRVQRFHPNGEFVLTFGKGVNTGTSGEADICTNAGPPTDVCGAGTQGSGAGQFNDAAQLALGPAGIAYVVDAQLGAVSTSRLQRFEPSGSFIGQCVLPTQGDPKGLVVDSTGNVYFADTAGGGNPGAVHKLNTACAEISPKLNESSNIQALALDAADNLFVSDNTEANSISRYDSGGTLKRVFYGSGTLQSPPIALAPYSSPGGDIFAAEGSEAKRTLYIAFPPAGPIVLPFAGETKANPSNTKATLNARINPEGKATTYHFEYSTMTDFSNCGLPANPNCKTTPESASIGSDFTLHSASAEIGCQEPEIPPQASCLTPETLYHFRVMATNAEGKGNSPIEGEPFETKRPFEIIATWASEVGTDAAQLHAQVNPLGIPTQGRFEYVGDAQFKASGFEEASKTEELDFGSKKEAATRGAQLSSLEPGTIYHYRIAVADPFRTEAGPERAFTTFPLPAEGDETCLNKDLRTALSALLPDCRAYEMVSPVDKGGGEITVLASGDVKIPAELTQSAAEAPAHGKGLTYSSSRAFGDAISAPFTSQYIASRGAAGWSSHGISPPREGAVSLGNLDTQYKAFGEDLGWGLVRSDSEPPLAAGALPGYFTLYRRDNAGEDYEAICPVKVAGESTGGYTPEPQGFTADGGLVIFRANAKLTKNASAAAKQLYGCEGGQLRLLSVGPDGKANPGSSTAGSQSSGEYREASVHNAVSADGARIYWSDLGKATEGSGRIYLRENPFGEGKECSGAAAPCTVAVSAAVGGPGADQGAQFWTASADGSTAIFRFSEGPLAGNLYEFNAEAETASLIAEGVSGVAGWSEDARRIYLISTKALAAGAEAGKQNLYLHEAGAGGGFKLVAAFPEGVGLGNYCSLGDDPEPVFRCTRATPDGRRLAFMSGARLSAYDNSDATSPEPCGKPKGLCDAEVYLYDAEANGGAGQLRCVSCNPSGGRPLARAQVINSVTSSIAALIPSWESGFYPRRPLSANGKRLFFESFDALLPRDTNGAEDVYEWEEAQSQAQCDEAGAELYVPSAGGCLSLISAGKSPRDSEFVDASADGSDVFFKTAASLLPQDPGLIDIYDARVEGGFPPEPSPQPPCEGEACQSPPAPPEPLTPASAAFEGEGDLGEGPAARCGPGKRKVRRHGKVRCVEKKRHKRTHSGRRGKR